MNRRGEPEPALAIVQVPRILPRLAPLPEQDRQLRYILLEEVIRGHLSDLFPGNRILGSWCLRITRNSELYIDEESSANLLKTVERELYNRRKGAALRLEIETGCPERLVERLTGFLGLSAEDVYPVDGPLDFTLLAGVDPGGRFPGLRYPSFSAPCPEPEGDYFGWIARSDRLFHHPYESFSAVVGFIDRAADDPRVLAIKQTLYRSGSDDRIFRALSRAARKGKQVTVVVELKARFDEDNNIRAARKLEEEGIHVLYGMVGYKIHCKMCLVIRREGSRIRRYVHLSTGNYNPTTARIYTDIGLLSAREDLGEDVGGLFNLLTGISRFQPSRKLLVAPFDLHRRMIGLVDGEAENARRGLPSRIVAKMNALVDEEAIQALYRASQAGVEIDLVVRGICCLRPGVPGLSENITVRSIVGRFLEHSRVFYFENAGRPRIYVGSADWMPRNFFSRIEVLFPLEDGVLRERVTAEILEECLNDSAKCRILGPDGSYRSLGSPEGAPPRSSQEAFLALAARSLERSRPGQGRSSARDAGAQGASPGGLKAAPRASTLYPLRRKESLEPQRGAKEGAFGLAGQGSSPGLAGMPFPNCRKPKAGRASGDPLREGGQFEHDAAESPLRGFAQVLAVLVAGRPVAVVAEQVDLGEAGVLEEHHGLGVEGGGESGWDAPWRARGGPQP